MLRWHFLPLFGIALCALSALQGTSAFLSQNLFQHGRSVNAASQSDPEPLESATPLPPGLPTAKLFNVLFDDTASFLSPRDMKLLRRKEKFGPIFKTNFLFQPTVFVSEDVLIQELARQEAVKELKAFSHHTTVHSLVQTHSWSNRDLSISACANLS
jgi:hypothetical protein